MAMAARNTSDVVCPPGLRDFCHDAGRLDVHSAVRGVPANINVNKQAEDFMKQSFCSVDDAALTAALAGYDGHGGGCLLGHTEYQQGLLHGMLMAQQNAQLAALTAFWGMHGVPLLPGFSFGDTSLSFSEEDGQACLTKTQRRRQRKKHAAGVAAVVGLAPAAAVTLGEAGQRDEESVERSAELRALGEAALDNKVDAVNACKGEVFSKEPGVMVRLAYGKGGCWCIQGAIVHADADEQAKIVKELKPYVHKLSLNPNGNYVVQRMVDTFRGPPQTAIIEEVVPVAVQIAKNRFGCRVLTHIIDSGSNDDVERTKVLEEMKSKAADLCEHPFGHHVISKMISNDIFRHELVADVLACSTDALCTHAENRNASYVIEEVLKVRATTEDPERVAEQKRKLHTIIQSRLRDERILVQVAMNQFGSFVIKALLDGESSVQLEDIVQKLSANSKTLEQNKHGLAVVEALELLRCKAVGACEQDLVLEANC